MERLTKKAWRNLDPWECCGQDEYCQRGCYDSGGCTGGCIVPRLYTRLGAYEDTGLTPEEVLTKDKADEIALKLMRLADLESICSYTRLRELAEADKEGRVAVLPCKVGGKHEDRKMGKFTLMTCKKCGYNHGNIIPYGHFRSNQITYRISCPICSYCTKEKATVEEAIGAWNRRTNMEQEDQ